MIKISTIRRKVKFISILVFTLIIGSCNSQKAISNEVAKAPQENKPLNIILMIGDGMGLSQVSSSYFTKETEPNFSRFPTIGLIKTSSGSHLITDSASGATAFSAGKKTYNGAIGVNMDTIAVKNIVESLSEKGYATGLIATSSITHATPASFFAHVKSRGLAEEIASDLPASDVDFFAGGGSKYFFNRKDGKSLKNKFTENDFIINTLNLQESQTLSKDKKYGFLLAKNAMPKMNEGRGDFLLNATDLSLNYLHKNETQGKNGFFLMVEGSQIDWGGHANEADYIKEEVLDFDKVIGHVLDFAEADGNTLVIVTADHETGGYTLASDNGNYNKIKGSFSTDGHSATLIPVFAYGKGSENFSGIYENTEIFTKIMELVDGKN
ncbi:alkaline phosphatase [Aureibaculum sp. 2210JD6-5]|uniref:alkaline phosphatase n=1 Tax=Aureibaculum sp. 2210JD6-5 TaxID=3103957 RepID=UPI002AAC7A47|nr:alkaline phosphatase [Aureibaculum sp. 2210JD6-5]MDY7395800.1 alkaline phosphatase [Aureibaculum sp. 2210JD6-5]